MRVMISQQCQSLSHYLGTLYFMENKKRLSTIQHSKTQYKSTTSMRSTNYMLRIIHTEQHTVHATKHITIQNTTQTH